MSDWSLARKKAFIIAVLRSGTRRWPPKYRVLNAAKTEKKINVKTGRMAQHYRCALCNGEQTAKDTQVDHILPAVDPTTGWESWDTFISRLFCEEDNLQAVCVACHAQKTKQERAIAKR